jgi:hypothetical protein
MSTPIDFRAVAEELLAAHPTSNLYFLLDHAGMPGLHRRLRDSSLPWASLFEGSNEENALQVAPFLVLAGSEGRLRMFRDLFKWIGEHGTYSSSVVMLTSPLDLATLHKRLAARLDLRLLENMEAMLRFFDPRVLESLLRILPTEQARTFFSPADSWRYVDRTGKLVSVTTAFDAQESFVAPLVLGQQQEFALLEACEIDQVLDLLRQNTPALMSTLSLADQSTFVGHAISTARQHGVDSVYKFSLYAAVSLSQGEEFVHGEQAVRFLANLKQDDFGSSDKLKIFDLDEKWRSV